MVKKGNPKNIKDFEDLTRDGVSFVNRQKGSGTRLLLDYKLKQRGLTWPAFTAMAARNSPIWRWRRRWLFEIDAGLGVYSAATALGLDFIPVCSEEYDLAVPIGVLEDSNIRLLLDIIRSEAFKEKVKAMGGYSTDRAGEIIPVN